jgi:hypothetical protein
MKMDLSKKEEEVAEVAKNEIIAAETAAVQELEPQRIGEIAGDIDEGDFAWPKLNLVQGVGKLSEEWAPGTLLFEKEVPLITPAASESGVSSVTDMLDITVLNARKQFCENLPFGSEETAMVVDTEAEAIELGGGAKPGKYVDNEPPAWIPFAQILVLFKAPNEAVAQSCGYEFDGDNYGVGLYRVQKTSWNFFKIVNTARMFRLRNGLHTGGWKMYAARERSGENMVWKPKLKHDGLHSPEMIEFAASIVGG